MNDRRPRHVDALPAPAEPAQVGLERLGRRQLGGLAGVRTQATFFAKRTSSRSGSGQWRKRSFHGGDAISRSPLSQVSRNAGP